MVIGVKEAPKVQSIVQAAITRHGTGSEALVPILSEINREVGYLPDQALAELGLLLKVPKSHHQ